MRIFSTNFIKVALFSTTLALAACSSGQEEPLEDEIIASEDEQPAEVLEELAGEASEEELASEEGIALEEAGDELDELSSEENLTEELAANTDEMLDTATEDEGSYEQASSDVDTESAQTEEIVEETEEEVASENLAPETFSYVVQKGDWVSKVALRVYGDMSKWQEIAETSNLSNPDLIYPGNVLTVPILNDQAREFANSYAAVDHDQDESVELAQTKTIKVEEGDTLSSIAKKLYGSASQWTKLVDNNSSITNADMIFVGQVLNV